MSTVKSWVMSGRSVILTKLFLGNLAITLSPVTDNGLQNMSDRDTNLRTLERLDLIPTVLTSPADCLLMLKIITTNYSLHARNIMTCTIVKHAC